MGNGTPRHLRPFVNAVSAAPADAAAQWMVVATHEPDSITATPGHGVTVRIWRQWREHSEPDVTNSPNGNPVLYIFSGLPGSGKSTLAWRLAKALRAVYLRVDTIEQALRDLCSIDVEGEGYRLAYRVAADNLKTGLSVVADSCNPIELTRREWEEVAAAAQVAFINIEITCSDAVEHRRRVESRESSIVGLRLSTWAQVRRREYQEWLADRILVDTAGRNEMESFNELLLRLGREQE
jgi:predicted kinase